MGRKIKKTDRHKQCKLQRGDTVTVSWIPAKFAVKGKYLKLKDEDGNWENGWQVKEVWGARCSLSVIQASEFYKSHRNGTDQYRDDDGNWVTRKEAVG